MVALVVGLVVWAAWPTTAGLPVDQPGDHRAHRPGRHHRRRPRHRLLPAEVRLRRGSGPGRAARARLRGYQGRTSPRTRRTSPTTGTRCSTWTAEGFGDSSGQIHLDSPDWEVKDAQRLIDWLAARPEVRRDGAERPAGRRGRRLLRRRPRADARRVRPAGRRDRPADHLERPERRVPARGDRRCPATGVFKKAGPGCSSAAARRRSAGARPPAAGVRPVLRPVRAGRLPGVPVDRHHRSGGRRGSGALLRTVEPGQRRSTGSTRRRC